MPRTEFTSAELVSRLAARFSGQEWAFFEQVPNATGGPASRTADALAMNLWPSRGLEIHGFEVKVSRSDWLRELKKPEKAEEIAAYCDRWWVVVAEAKIVQPGELPPTWGLLGPRGDGLVAVVDAPKLSPKPVDRGFLAAILRKATVGVVPASEVQARIEAAEARIEQREQERDRLRDERIEELERTIAEFEKRSGLRISRWDGPEVGDAVNALLRGDAAHAIKDMEHVREVARRALAEMDEHITAARAGLTAAAQRKAVG